MNITLLKPLIALVPASALLSGSAVLFYKSKTVSSLLQLVGAGCIVVVVLAHVSEALHLFPSMDWGQEHSIGHYLDFCSAVLALSLFPIGYLLHALKLMAMESNPFCQIECVPSDSDVGMPGKRCLKRRKLHSFFGAFTMGKEEVAAMRSSWQIEAGHLECRWSELGQRVRYNPPWMQEATDVQGSYVPPLPNFASHSPFGGATWFDRYAPRHDSE